MTWGLFQDTSFQPRSSASITITCFGDFLQWFRPINNIILEKYCCTYNNRANLENIEAENILFDPWLTTNWTTQAQSRHKTWSRLGKENWDFYLINLAVLQWNADLRLFKDFYFSIKTRESSVWIFITMIQAGFYLCSGPFWGLGEDDLVNCYSRKKVSTQD